MTVLYKSKYNYSNDILIYLYHISAKNVMNNTLLVVRYDTVIGQVVQ